MIFFCNRTVPQVELPMSSLYEGLFFHRQYAEQYVGIITTRLELLNKLYNRPFYTFDATATTTTTTTTTTPTTATTNPITATPAVSNPTTATATATTTSPAPPPLPPLPPSGPSMPLESRALVRALQSHALPPVVRSTVQSAERRVLVDGFRYRQQQLRTPNLAPIVEPIRAAWRRRFATGAGTSNIRVTAQTLYFMPTAVALHLLDRYRSLETLSTRTLQQAALKHSDLFSPRKQYETAQHILSLACSVLLHVIVLYSRNSLEFCLITCMCSTRTRLVRVRLSSRRHLGSSGQTQASSEPQQQDLLVEFAYLLDSDAKHLYELMRMNTCLQEMIQHPSVLRRG